jgi:hypothetical protein
MRNDGCNRPVFSDKPQMNNNLELSALIAKKVTNALN